MITGLTVPSYKTAPRFPPIDRVIGLPHRLTKCIRPQPAGHIRQGLQVRPRGLWRQKHHHDVDRFAVDSGFVAQIG